MEASMKNCSMNLDTWKNTAADYSTLRSQVAIDIANVEQTRNKMYQKIGKKPFAPAR